MRVDVAVIGAGIQGSSVALRLAQAGAKVAVLERGIPGAEASSAAGGILSPGVEAVEPGPFHALCRASLERYPSFVREVEALSGMSIGFRALGTLEVALDETHAKVLAGRAEKMLRHGLPVEVLDESAVRRLEPAISPSARGALFFPDEASVDPRLLARAVYIAAARAGATFLTGQVKRIVVDGGRARGGGGGPAPGAGGGAARAAGRRRVGEPWSTPGRAGRGGEPILGAGTVPGLFYATGHTRNGILLAPVTADAIGAAILGRSAPMDLSPFSPARLPGILGRKS